MAHSSLITLTEISRDWRSATLREKGWGHFNASAGGGADDCGIAWRTDTWHRKDAFARRLSTMRFPTVPGYRPIVPTYAATALLKHVSSDKTLLVSCAHMPAHIEGHFRYPGTEQWRARKRAYTSAVDGWSTMVLNQSRRHKPDAVLVVADWNLNLKYHWVREYFHDHWKKAGLKGAWQHFPTGGTHGNRIIDGSYIDGLEVTDGPELLGVVRSSDHRPYRETLKLLGGAKPEDNRFYNPATGHVEKGKEWWGFGDYQYDEMFEKVKVTEEGTVVTFDFDEPPY